ncbi:hypothetical protein DS731_07485 [Alteromonas sp. RKMC-009]|nr:hypothetical protein DS731_07485 [Alteromonas sp. RKMC-009]
MFKFTCEICNKQVKRGRKFDCNMFEMDSDSTGNGHICFDEICFSCAKKIENKIETMRRKGRIVNE